MSLYFGNLQIPSVKYTTVISNISLEEKTVTPTKSIQKIVPSNNAQGLSSVTVNPIPNSFIEPKNTLQISTSGEHNVTQYAKVNVTFPSFVTQNKIITPTTSEQVITAETGYNALNSVTVKAIETESKTVSVNGTYTPTSGKFFSTFTVNVPAGATINNQNKSVTPTETAQTISFDTGYTGLNEVIVDAIPSTYIGSEINKRTASNLSVSGATVTVPSGYYEKTVSKSVATGTAGSPIITKGTVTNHEILLTPTVTNSTGYITGGMLTGTAITVKASELVDGNMSITANGDNIDVTTYATVSVNVPNNGSTIRNQNKSITPTESKQTISADNGYTGLGIVTVTAIPSTYIGSEIAQKTATDLTVSGATVSVPAGYYETSVSKAVASGSAGTPTATKGAVSGNKISITPKVTNTTGYIVGETKTGTAVTVSASELVSGNKSITANGTNIDVTNYKTVSVNVPSSGVTINNQDITVSPSTSKQTITADSEYTGLGTVTINAMPSGSASTPATTITANPTLSTSYTSGSGYKITVSKTQSVTPTISAGYVSAGIAGTITVSGSAYVAQSTITNNTTLPSGSTSSGTINAGSYIKIGAGYYPTDRYYIAQVQTQTNGSVTAPSTISGTSATVSHNGTTLTLAKTISVTPNVTTAGYISSGTAGNSNVSLSATDANFIAANIKTGVSIFGVTGTYSGLNTNDADAVAADINNGKIAYVKGEKITGTQVINKYYTGSSAPASSLGSNGDIYFQE